MAKKAMTKKEKTNQKPKVVNERKEIVSENRKEIVKQDITIALLIILCILMLIFIILWIKGHEVKLKEGKEIIASVEGKEITAEDLFDELKRQNGINLIVNTIDDFIANKEMTDSDEAKKYASAQLASLKQQYAAMGYDFKTILASNGYENEEQLVKEFIADYKKNEVVKNYISSHLTDDEINAYYEKEIHGKITVKHILVKPDVASTATTEEKTKAEEAAKTKAQEVIQKLNEGSAWADLVAQYSDDTASKPDEGLIEIVDENSVVEEFYKASIALTDNEYSKEPVKSQFGYHVILKIKEEEKPSLENSKDKVKKNLVSNKLDADNRLADKTWVEIRKNYKLKINDTKIEKIYNSIIEEFTK